MLVSFLVLAVVYLFSLMSYIPKIDASRAPSQPINRFNGYSRRESVEDEVEVEPKIEQVEFAGKLTGTFEDIKAQGFAAAVLLVPGGRGQARHSEGREREPPQEALPLLHNNREARRVSVTYSIIPGSSDRLRRAVIIKNFASVLSIMADSFHVDEVKLFQYIDSVVDNLVGGMSQDYSSLFNKYDAMFGEYTELKKLSQELGIANRNLTIQTGQLNEENKSLVEQLRSLQTYSDEALMAMVQDWIEVHSSSIDVGRVLQDLQGAGAEDRADPGQDGVPGLPGAEGLI